MKDDYEKLAHEFLSGLTRDEKEKLYNDLLALEAVHLLNQNNHYYTLRNLRHLARKHYHRKKRLLRYMNSKNDELQIAQIYEQHFLKNIYCVKISINLKEYDFHLIKSLLSALTEPEDVYSLDFQELSV